MNLQHSNNEVEYVKDYYDYIVQKLKSLKCGEKTYELVGLHYNKPTTENFLYVNYEHNILHPNEILSNLVKTSTKLIDGTEGTYNLRIENPHMFLYSQFYLEYSMPNITNIANSELPKTLMEKIIYFPPLLCEYYNTKSNREDYDVITSIYHLNISERPRRKLIFDRLTESVQKYSNLPKVFGEQLYEDYYKKSKILVNLHQTDNHHTVEELRILPALMNGLIVISENSPLKETIPYNEYIIWTSYDKIIDTTLDVLNNYDSYFEKIHGEKSKLKSIFSQMSETLTENLKNKFE